MPGTRESGPKHAARRAHAAATARGALDRDHVLRAAIALADQGGLQALSMRKLGHALGVEAMSLYNHVAGKDGLLDGMVEQVTAEIALPTECADDWVAAMRGRALSAHAVWQRHPWATTLVAARAADPGPSQAAYHDAAVELLVDAGFPDGLARHACLALDSYVHGFALQAPGGAAEREGHANAFGFGLELLLDGLRRTLDAGVSVPGR